MANYNTKYAWDAVDWTKPCTTISKELGASRSIVSHARCVGTTNLHVERGLERWASVDWTRRVKDIAEEMGVSASTVTHAKAKYGFTR